MFFFEKYLYCVDNTILDIALDRENFMRELNFPVAPAISLLLQVYSTPDIKSCLQVEMEIK